MLWRAGRRWTGARSARAVFTTFARRVIKDHTCNLGAVAWGNDNFHDRWHFIASPLKDNAMRAISASALFFIALTAGVVNAAENAPMTTPLVAADDTTSGAGDSATGTPNGGNAGTGSTADTASPS